MCNSFDSNIPLIREIITREKIELMSGKLWWQKGVAVMRRRRMRSQSSPPWPFLIWGKPFVFFEEYIVHGHFEFSRPAGYKILALINFM